MNLTTQTGRLTAYGLCCGYVERKVAGYIETEMYEQHGGFHVRQFNRDPEVIRFRVFWKVFPSVRRARNFFNRQRGRLNVADKILPNQGTHGRLA